MGWDAGARFAKVCLEQAAGAAKKKRKEALFIADAISDEQSRLPS